VKSPSPPPLPDRERELEEGIKRRREQRDRWEREGERPVALNLAMIGALGWLIILPTLAGIFAGQWLDRREGTGVTFTAALLVAGVALGAVLAWQKMHRS
jgi:ATP synthase protein I